VDDPGVVPGLVGCQAVLLLEDHDPATGVAMADFASDGQTDDATADDANGLLCHVVVLPAPVLCCAVQTFI